ncbi:MULTISPECIES: WecB/TagA/CpsF family glycosyltransferase [Pseudomonas]|uniref:WecB/TagA/CpsF family glycosyltransferase n=1 Tax=Pseudomonas TaxID=286 RepID=UPI000FAFEDCD|nr:MULTISPECIES: WecB/TagA/CpsF family glycosyltransferase [Pseudomonas]MBD9589024.1 WecB/TagA/CpsF family glycosyltransferase [Pseudomonas sp. PDM03]MBD9614873.1 WecB/TagA/CpsF family glycosyltransferase [Pseudomonas sp. PDM02]MCP1519174.1 exopolysaccharide biosynthesis WecB/TagA/CpsF family protein [Pseudomonas migulae]
MSPLSWQHNWQTILRKLRVVRDAGDEQQLIDALSRSEGTTVLGFVNAHAMNLVTANPAYYDALSAADVLLRDGSGMAILYRRLGLEPGLNMNGTDFIPKLLAAYKGRRVAFWGTEETFLANAVRHCEAVFAVNVVSAHHGFAGVDDYVNLARQSLPELVVLGMGMPKQEVVAARLAASGVPCLVVCGGAILDFLGGKVTRAPQWVRRLGCEWVFRLLSEPKRLFTRYIVGNPKFLLRTLICRSS